MRSFHLYRFSFLNILFLFLLQAAFLNSYSQDSNPEWGHFSAAEVNMKECSFDTEADAIILLDEGISDYDEEYRLITKRRTRIKILNAKGFDRANIVIPFYSKDDFEYIGRIEGFTYNFDQSGGAIPFVLDKKNIYKERRDSRFSLMKFAMPAVKEGCIIEYRYELTTKGFTDPDDWEFQYDIPTIKSTYLLQVPPKAEFTYQMQKSRNMQFVVKPIPNLGKIYFEMSNIPGLRFEPYMDAARDYIQKVSFQLSGIQNVFGDKQSVNTTWKSLAYELMTDKTFGSQLDKDIKASEINMIAATASSATGRLKVIYEYVKKNIAWNGYNGRYVPNGLRSVLDNKKGSAGEMNLLLVNLLRSNGIETYPVLVAERDFGKVDTTYPFVERFNKTVALAIADGTQYLLDATQENCPAGLTPYPFLNTTGFLVDKNKYNLIKIMPGNRSYKNEIIINGVMDIKGMISAEANVKSYEYARQLRLDEVKIDRKKFVNENFEKPYEGVTIDSFLVSLPQHDSLPFEQVIRYNQQLNESGGFIFINTNLFTGLSKNPFVSSTRFTNVNFGFPYNVTVRQTIKLPAGAKIDLPEDKVIRSTDNKIEALKQVKFENGELKVVLKFVQNITLVVPELYPALKGLYKQMVDMLNEPILVKLGN